MAKRIIVVDDEEGMRRYLNKMLTGWGYEAETFADPLLMLKFLGQTDSDCDLVLLDVKMPEMDGIEALTRIRSLRPELPVIMMTGHGTIDSAVEAMKIGAYDYLSKPFPQEKLQSLLVHAMEREKLREENLSLKKELQERHTPGKPVFVSDKFRQVYELALRVAASDANILVLGQRNDILPPLPQGRQVQADDVEAVIEVLPKTALGHLLFQILVGDGDEADIDLFGAGGPDGDELAFLNDA